jgi:hypothetical protein
VEDVAALKNDLSIQQNYIADLETNLSKATSKKNHRPVKGDIIDQSLAKVLNQRQELPVKFKRESYGVYNFGTKRVSVRVDKARLYVRVGGGSISVDEFIDTYTKPE